MVRLRPKESKSVRKTGIDIIIPSFNGKQFLVGCLASIKEQSFTSYEVIVVDNGSTDGTVDFLQENYPEVRLIALSLNRGFSAAVNAGIVNSDSPYIFLLNNDTELAPACLSHLVQAAGALPEYDFFAPKMLSYHERDILDGAGDGFLRGGVGYRLGTMEKDGDAYDISGQVFGACAGAALYRRTFFDIVGLFDEDFFAYLEDVDLNLRANRTGLCCRYVPEARVYHIGSATTGSRINEITVRLSTRNNFFVLLKNYPLLFFLRFLPVICIYQFSWFLFVIKKRQVSAYLRGVCGVVGYITQMRKKYRRSLASSDLSQAEFFSLLITAEDSVVSSIMRRRKAEGKGNFLLFCYRFFFL